MNNPLLEIKDLYKFFPVKAGFGKVLEAKAVDGVSLTVARGEAVGLVGESGCGKSTLGRLALRLLEPQRATSFLRAGTWPALGKEELRALRKKMQIIFQDPFASLNPRMRIKEIITEPLVIHGIARESELEDRGAALLQKVGLPVDALRRYPARILRRPAPARRDRARACQRSFLHRCRRAGLRARCFGSGPDHQPAAGPAGGVQAFLPVHRPRPEHRAAFFGSVAVMYLGRIVEIAPAEEIYRNPSHPYTEALLADIPVADPTRKKKHILLKGDIPSPTRIPPGCRFHTRCIYRFEPCDKIFPRTTDLGNGHFVECHLRDETIRSQYK